MTMLQEWYILVDGEQEGPYDVEELMADFRLTPDTFVWKEGLENWKPIREVPELRDLFNEAKNEEEEGEAIRPRFTEERPPDDGVLVAENNSPNPFLWILLILAILVFIFTRFYL